MSLNLVFAGTPAFGQPSLERLIERGDKPVAVLTQPDRPAGRGRSLQASPIKQMAIAHNIPVHQPDTLKGFDLAALDADLLITAAYGLLLPKAVLDAPRLGCWNLHASLLPRWRGASPIQQAILAGDQNTGISLMQMDEGLDTGPVIMQQAIAIKDDETAGQLHDRLALVASELLIEALDALAAEQLPRPTPQPSEGVVHAPLIKKADAKIDWTQSAKYLERMVRAYNPWPVAYTDIFSDLGVNPLRIWEAKVGEDTGLMPGTLLRGQTDAVVVACGKGSLRLTSLQAPGKRPLSAKDWFNAHPDWR